MNAARGGLDMVEPCRPNDLGRFEIHRRSGSARNGRLHTGHGVLQTPALLPVVNPNILTIPPAEMWEKHQIRGLITNSYIFWKHEELREKAVNGGVHEVLGFPGMVMTDSGTFQNYIYGDVEVGVEEIVKFQAEMGVDIGTMLDVFGRPDQSREELEEAVQETARRAVPSLNAAGAKLLLNGPIQGGLHSDLRTLSASLMGGVSVTLDASNDDSTASENDSPISEQNSVERGFVVHPIGGIVPLMEQRRYRELVDIVLAAKAELPIERPIHLFGCGHPMLFALAVAMGVDLFDSAAYALFARDGRLLSIEGTIKLEGLEEWPVTSVALAGVTPESVRAMSETDRTGLLARHNLEVSVTEIRACREAIRTDSIHALAERRSHASPRLRQAYEHLVNRLSGAVSSDAHSVVDLSESTSGEEVGHLIEMVRSASPIRSGREPVTPNLLQHPRSLHLNGLLRSRWTPPPLRHDGVAASGRGRVILLHGSAPPWRETAIAAIQSSLLAEPDTIPLIWTPLGAIPYSLEDVAPWCHLEGPDDIWRYDGANHDAILESLGLAGRPLEVLDLAARDEGGFSESAESVESADSEIGRGSDSAERLDSVESVALNSQIGTWLERWSAADKFALLLAVPASISWPMTAGMQAVRSRTGRVKNLLMADGRHIISPRLVDGGISLTKEGAKLLHSARIADMPIGFPKSAPQFSGSSNHRSETTFPPSNETPDGPSSAASSELDLSYAVDSRSDLDIGVPWVVIEDGAVPFVGQGRNVIHGFITAADSHLSPGLSCLVVDALGRLVAEGVALSTAAEMGRFRKGLAVKVRNGFLKA